MELESYKPFFECANGLLAIGGLLLVVTFKGSRGDGVLLREELTGETVGPDPQLAHIVSNMQKLGTVKIEKVYSHLRSQLPEDMIEWLAGWLFRSAEEKQCLSERASAILEARYWSNGWFVFPMEHLFISVTKDKR